MYFISFAKGIRKLHTVLVHVNSNNSFSFFKYIGVLTVTEIIKCFSQPSKNRLVLCVAEDLVIPVLSHV
jgi:hypothetical protein